MSPVALRAGGSTWELLVCCVKKAFCDLRGSGENQPEPRSSCVCGALALLRAPQQEQLFVLISGDYFRFGGIGD